MTLRGVLPSSLEARKGSGVPWRSGSWPQREASAFQSRRALKRAEHGSQHDDRDEREYGAQDGNHEDVEIAFLMRRPADGEQRDHGAVMRQAVERSRTDNRHT